MPQIEILASLVLQGAPSRPSELAEETLLAERSTVSRNLAALRGCGYWVEAAGVSPSGRSMAVAVTPEGARVLGARGAAWAEAQASMVGSLGPETPATMDTWLDDLT